MSSRETSPSQVADDAAYASYDDPAYDDTIDTAVHERIVDDVVDETADAPDAPEQRAVEHEDVEHDEAGSRSAQAELMGRRRRTLLMLAGLVLVTLLFAVIVGSWAWIPQVIADLMLVGYVVHLRNETRRQEERRLTRDIRDRRSRPAATGSAAEKSQSSLAASAFLVTPVTEIEPVMLDDEDPAFYDVADAPVSDRIDLSGHDYYSEYQDVDYDYESEDYGIQAVGAEDHANFHYPKAV